MLRMFATSGRQGHCLGPPCKLRVRGEQKGTRGLIMSHDLDMVSFLSREVHYYY